MLNSQITPNAKTIVNKGGKSTMNQTKFLKSIKHSLKKSSPLILTCIGACGVAVTAVSAVKATPKAIKLIDKETKKKGEKLTPFEVVKATWTCYIYPTIIGASTILCIFSANALNKKQQAVLTSAYALINQKYKDYANKVKELYGEETHKRIIEELAVEKAKDVSIITPGLIESSSIDFEDEDEEPRLFYDSFSERYFESTISKVLQAEYYLNRNFCLGWIPSVNDFYDFLGLEHTEIGDEIGWTNSNGDYYWIDFNHFKAKFDDGLECWVIETEIPPSADYLADR